MKIDLAGNIAFHFYLRFGHIFKDNLQFLLEPNHLRLLHTLLLFRIILTQIGHKLLKHRFFPLCFCTRLKWSEYYGMSWGLLGISYFLALDGKLVSTRMFYFPSVQPLYNKETICHDNILCRMKWSLSYQYPQPITCTHIHININGSRPWCSWCIVFVQMFFPLGSTSTAIYGGISAVFSSGYIVYDTDNLIKRFTYDEYIWASVTLYLDILNLFLAILRVLRSGDN